MMNPYCNLSPHKERLHTMLKDVAVLLNLGMKGIPERFETVWISCFLKATHFAPVKRPIGPRESFMLCALKSNGKFNDSQQIN